MFQLTALLMLMCFTLFLASLISLIVPGKDTATLYIVIKNQWDEAMLCYSVHRTVTDVYVDGWGQDTWAVHSRLWALHLLDHSEGCVCHEAVGPSRSGCPATQGQGMGPSGMSTQAMSTTNNDKLALDCLLYHCWQAVSLPAPCNP